MQEKYKSKKMTGKYSKNQRLISALIIVAIIMPAIVLFSQPKRAAAQWAVFDAPTEFNTAAIAGNTTASTFSTGSLLGLSVKEAAASILRQILMGIAKNFLKKMTQSTINWINSGFHGSPLFVQNPKSFFGDIAKYEVKTFVDEIGYDSLRFPFGTSTALNIIDSYKKQFADNAQYSLSKVINDPVLLARYRADFNIGGWNGFLLNTQYPQNNYIGSQMIVTDELSRRLAGTVNNNAQIIQDTLQKGMGFLSPQTCPSRPGYNNLQNQFNQPKFNAAKAVPWNFTATVEPIINVTQANPEGEPNPEYADQLRAYQMNYDSRVDVARVAWDVTNNCPGGLVATTPGSVVADQIMGALSSGREQGQLAAAMGNSLSTILDSLLNHFMDKGLTALATKVNPRPVADDWSYFGTTLGSPSDDPNAAWNMGPDDEISLDIFRKQLDGKTIILDADGINIAELLGDGTGRTVALPDGTTVTMDAVGKAVITKAGVTTTGTFTFIVGDIANTQTELGIITNDTDPANPGIAQMFGLLWPQSRELDICLPGPDLNWEERVTQEQDRNSKKLEEGSADEDPDVAAFAQTVLNELKFAVNYYKDWVNNKMIKSLPSSILYMDAVDDIHNLSQESDELTRARREKSQALARLQSIKTALTSFIVQPVPGSPEEKTLVLLRKQYLATKLTVSNAATVDDRKNDLAVAKEKYANLINLTTRCGTEREAQGWTNPGGVDSLGPIGTMLGGGGTATEQELFCEMPASGGYTHATFKGPDRITPRLPMINGKKVMTVGGCGFFCFISFGAIGGRDNVDIELNCDYIYKAHLLEYKGNLPGETTVIDYYHDEGSDGSGGTCDVPADADKHASLGDFVTQAKDELAAGGMTWVVPVRTSQTDDEWDAENHAYECSRFEIVKRAAQLMPTDDNPGLYIKTYGNNCSGFAVDIIAFPDGYLYDVLSGTSADGAGTGGWTEATCLPVDRDRYSPPI